MNNRNLFLRVLEARSLRSRHWQTWRLEGSASQFTDDFCRPVPHVVEGVWALWGLFNENTNLTHKGSTLNI